MKKHMNHKPVNESGSCRESRMIEILSYWFVRRKNVREDEFAEANIDQNKLKIICINVNSCEYRLIE